VARILLLLKPLLRRGEGGGLVRQAGPQQLSLLSLLLGLALPRLCPIEGSAVLLELSSSGSQLPLEFRRRNPHRGHILAHLPQRLVPLQERFPHLRDCGGVFRSLASCSSSSSRTTCSPYSSHPLSVCRASTRASRASYWSRYQLRLELS
jgi:hypothetical protein